MLAQWIYSIYGPKARQSNLREGNQSITITKPKPQKVSPVKAGKNCQ